MEKLDAMFESTDVQENDPGFSVDIPDTVDAKEMVKNQTQENTVQQTNELDDLDTDQPKKKKGSVLPLVIIGVIFVIIVLVAVLVLNNRKKAQLAAEQARIEQEEQERALRELEEQSMDVPEFENPDDVHVSMYTEEQKQVLRSYGLNADEIQKMEDNTMSYDQVVSELREAIYKRYQDIAKEAFKDLNHEGIPGEGQWLVEGYENLEGKLNEYTDNVSYQKMPVYGLQCYLKIWTSNKLDKPNEYVYWNVAPDIYNALEQEGSIKVTYNYIWTDTKNGYFVYDIKLAEDDDITRRKIDKWWDDYSKRKDLLNSMPAGIVQNVQ